MTNSLKEIELKLYIGGDLTSVVKKINDLGWKELPSESQKDIYYTSKHKDFIATEECLRIRTKDGELAELTWKPATSTEMKGEKQYWKREINVIIASQVDIVRELLQMLDFVEYVVVEKQRRTFEVDESSLVMLDFVKPLGWFVEIETFAKDAGFGVDKNTRLLTALGLQRAERINTPYRDLVKAGSIQVDRIPG